MFPRAFMKMSIPKFLVATCFLFTCISICAQPTPVLEWQKCLGSDYGEYARCVQPTSDGGYIITGVSYGADNGDVMVHHGNATVGDMWVIKMDKAGNVEWQRSLGGNQSEDGAFVIQTADGGYMLAGSAASTDCNMTGNHGGFDFWLVKLNTNGGVVWQKMYGGSRIDDAHSLAASADGGYFVAGLTRSENGDVTGNHGNVDAWIIKVDATGNLIWQKALGGTGFEEARSVKATPDGGCIVGGITGSDNGDITGFHGVPSNSTDYWVVKLDNKGTIQWQKALGGSMSELGGYVQLTADGGYIVAGHSNSSDGDVSGNRNSFDAWIVKLDAGGAIVWQKTYGGTGNESVDYIENTPDGGYVFTGTSLFIADGDIKCNAGITDVLLMKINATGNLEWEKTLGGSQSEGGFFVKGLDDGSFIVAGYTDSPDIPGFHTPVNSNIDDSDYWIIKLTAPLNTIPAPVVKIDPASAILCTGKNKATLTASVLYGGVSPVYQWTKNGIPVGTNSPQYTDLNLTANDQVSCSVTHGNRCDNSTLKGSDMVSIKYKTNGYDPYIKIVADNTYACNCTTITFNATVSNAGGSPTYQWMVNGINVGTNASVYKSVALKEGDVITCAYSDNSVCTADEKVISNSIRISSGYGAVPSVTIAAPAAVVCKGATVTFSANALNAGASPVYQWKINNINAGTNSSIFTSAALSNGDIVTCSIKTDPLFTCAASTAANSNSMVMQVADQAVPSVNIAASAETICTGSTVTFTATANNAGVNPAYQWKLNGVSIGANDKNYSSALLADNDIINCTVTVDPLFGCVLSNQAVSQNIVMTVNSATVPSVDITASKNNVCAGENILFAAVAHNAGADPVYRWILNNTILQDDKPVYSSNKLANGDQLFCRITPGAGACSVIPDSSDIFVAIVKDTPVVYLFPADTTIAPGMQVQLNSIVTGNIASFQWIPADKLISPLSLTPQTALLNETTYFKLTVTNDQGCSAAATATIKIFTGLYMPNAFTPNDDGMNDLFRIPPTNNLTLKEFSVYDRWGNRIFTTKNSNRGWDGTFNGKKQNAGVYTYFIRSIINSKEIFLKGNFTLVR